MKHDLRRVASQFRIDGRFVDAAPYGSGHINDTYASRIETSGGVRRYIHQRINHRVFCDPERLMENIERVTRHLRGKVEAAGGEADREALTVVPALDGRSLWRDEASGEFWRTYLFIEGARTYDVVTSPEHAERSARAFGRFQEMLSDLPGPRLVETIPAFHDTPRRVAALRAAVEADAVGRVAEAEEEIRQAMARAERAGTLVELAVPERITHNDTKCNNVMIDDATGEGVCVIDLDTVMPGLAVVDFGELVRTGANPAAEDERDLSKVGLDLGMFERLARGYLSAAGKMLTPLEIEHLPQAAMMMTYENGVRFLTDHLSGDTYYKVHRPGHNLDRCRVQLALLADMERKAERMAELVAHRRGG